MAVALLAVAVGSAIISGMVTVYREVPRQLGREFRAYGANLLLLPTDGRDSFSPSDVEKVREILRNKEVIGIAPFRYENLEINKQPTPTGGTDFAELKKVSPYWRIDGDYPASDKAELLLGAAVAEKLSREPHDMIGRTVTVSAGEGKALRSFVVAGIVSTGGKEEEYAFMPLGELERLTEKDSVVSLAQISVVADEQALAEAENAIRAASDAIEPQAVTQITRSEYGVLEKLHTLVLLVTVIVLLLTLICVTTTMIAVVTERRREIGLKKALGASDKDIIGEFCGEGCLLGVFGGVLGSVTGYLFAQSVSFSVFGRGIDFSPPIALAAILLSVLVTAVAAVIPVRIATGVDPAVVLRGE